MKPKGLSDLNSGNIYSARKKAKNAKPIKADIVKINTRQYLNY